MRRRIDGLNVPVEVEDYMGELVAIAFGTPLRQTTIAIQPQAAKELARRLNEVAADVEGSGGDAPEIVEDVPPRGPAGLVFKEEDVAEDGDPIGPIFLVDESGEPLADVWVTRTQAMQIAEAQGLRFDGEG